MHRKGWETCRSSKSYNLSLDCPLVLFKMADKTDFNEPANTPKSNEQVIYLKSAVYPSQCNVEKTTETDCILWPVPAFGWAPVIKRWQKNRSRVSLPVFSPRISELTVKFILILAWLQLFIPWLCNILGKRFKAEFWSFTDKIYVYRCSKWVLYRLAFKAWFWSPLELSVAEVANNAKPVRPRSV